jgi:hypothetical protein
LLDRKSDELDPMWEVLARMWEEVDLLEVLLVSREGEVDLPEVLVVWRVGGVGWPVKERQIPPGAVFRYAVPSGVVDLSGWDHLNRSPARPHPSC